MKGLTQQVSNIARHAGNAIMVIYSKEDFGVEQKSDLSPLTKADRAANDIIVQALGQLKPLYPVLSEESREIPYHVRKDFERFWLVDPLDGTKEFIKRNGEFTVNIALIEEQRPILGVVYVPATGDLFYAEKGEGAFMIKGDIHIRLTASSYGKADNGLRVVASRSHMNDETSAYLTDLNKPQIVSKGSSLKFLLLASGEAEIYPRIGPTMEWDTAAAQIILEEAGGSITIFGSDTPLRYNKENLLNPNFVARGRELA